MFGISKQPIIVSNASDSGHFKMSLASVNRLESVEIHIAIQTAEEAKNEPSSPQGKAMLIFYVACGQ